MRVLATCLLSLLLCAVAFGQSTTVSATVTDQGAQVWGYGTYSFVFKVNPANPSNYFWNGSPFNTVQTISGNLSATGTFSVSVPSNTAITPVGSTWVYTVCPAASSPCYSTTVTVTGASQSLSGINPPAVSVSLTNPPAGVKAYADSEITGANPGSFYFNITDSTLHFCAQGGFPPCTWISIGSTTSLLPSTNTWTGPNTWTNTATFNGSFNATNGGSLAGTFSGNWTDSGNRTDTGNNTHSGTETFSGPLVNTGTDSGNQTISGNKAFTGTNTFGNIDNIRYIDGTKFAKTAAGINAADSDCGTSTACVIEVSYPGTYSDATISIGQNHFLRFRSTGTYTIKQILGPDSNSVYTLPWGIQCPEHAMIQEAASTNLDMITTPNFLTLSGTGTSYGSYHFTLQGCIVDGNRSNQSALISTGSITITNVARTAGGVTTLTFGTGPTFMTGMTVQVFGITNDGGSFNGDFIVQSAGSTTITYNQQNQSRNTVGSAASTCLATSGCIAIGFTGANGVRIIGWDPQIEDNQIQNNVMDDLWTEGFGLGSTSTNQLEGDIQRNRLQNSGRTGFVFWGPQMTRVRESISVNHGSSVAPGWGHRIFQALMASQMQGYLNPTNQASCPAANTGGAGSMYIGYAAGVIGGVGQESAGSNSSCTTVWGILADTGAATSSFGGESALCFGCVSVEARAKAAFSYQGVVYETQGGIGIKFNGGSGEFNIAMGNNGTAAGTLFDCTSEVGYPVINVTSAFLNASDTVKGTSCWAGSEQVFLPNTSIGNFGDSSLMFLNEGVYRQPCFTDASVPGVGSYGLFYFSCADNRFKINNNNTGAFDQAQVIPATSASFATATTAGTCVQNTTAVTGATTGMAVSISPVSTPGVGAVWSAFVSSAGNVTINECAVATSAGGTIAFNIRVTP